MCLSTVTSTKRDHKREGTGWKVFRLVDGGLYGEFYSGIAAFREGSWTNSNNCMLNKKPNYPLGFHIFRTREAARTWRKWSLSHARSKQRVRKVRWRDLLAEGMQQGSLPAIVDKEMMIL